MDLKTLTNMFPSHKLVMGEQFSQENISALKVKSILNWSDTIFVNCDFSEAQFHLLMLSGTIFFECDFAGALFRACDIDGSEFISCNLTCADMQASAVSDTSFTDCVIGGFLGPQDFNSCSFVYPRYARRTRIISQYPYVVVTTAEGPLVLFKTPTGWQIHAKNQRHSFGFDEKDIPAPYAGAIEFAAKLAYDQDRERSIRMGETVD
ncbi:MAG: pentapeptide repeat-containing protein [Kordiimonadaceae bacterium]|nr:pentapeptide repeat-containing protein [Kordiimonadaceae bacterium]MBL4790368.1 pentapeptide repeat-containing protein [Kordiimonadaceae bacterium]